MNDREHCSVFQDATPSAVDGSNDTQKNLEKLDNNE